MIVYVVSETDERPEAMQSGPLSAHLDEGRATDAVNAFNAEHKREVGHYAIVVPLKLDAVEVSDAAYGPR